MKALIGLNTIGRTLLFAGDDEQTIKHIKDIARRADIAIQEIEVTDEDVLKLMQDNSYIEELMAENQAEKQQEQQ